MKSNKQIKYYSIILFTVLIAACNNSYDTSGYVGEKRLPVIFPDYVGIVVPPNIAPINFLIKETGNAFKVDISSKNGDPISISSDNAKIEINESKWHKLLNDNKGNDLLIDIYARNTSGKWTKYETIKNLISKDEVDKYVVYRLINAGYVLWEKMGIYQRNIESFDQECIVDNYAVKHACVNCHSFCKNDPKTMSLHIRAALSGTIIIKDGKIKKVDTKTQNTSSAGVYPAWHPNGKIIAYSTNSINQFFHNAQGKSIEVSDLISDIIVYNTETDEVSTSPKISTPMRENLPEWSPDGKYLYYISAPEAKDFDTRQYAKYDLLRIAYDEQNNRWGEVDTVLRAKDIGGSITFPKCSPDGKHILFCLTDYGYFTIHHSNSDLYLFDLETKTYRKAEVNSNSTESYHSWSSTGRWFVFSSRRINGQYTQTYLAHFDENGKCSKPLVLPQKDPTFYNSYLLNFNRPELIRDRVEKSALRIRDAIWNDATPTSFVPE